MSSYVPLNTRMPNLEDTLLYQNIVLPYFKGITLQDMLKIKENETDAFEKILTLIVCVEIQMATMQAIP